MTNLPFNGKFKVTCEYGRKNSFKLKWAAGYHTGMDLVGITSKDVYSVCDGTVIFAANNGSYGKCVKVRDSKNGKVFLYAHLASISVKVNQKVTRATKIGVMGETGNAIGAHLHIELRTRADKYGIVENIANYFGIPNKVGTYNSKDYQISENKYKQGDVIEVHIPVQLTGANEGENVLVDTNGYQYWVHRSVIKDGQIIARATIAYVEPTRCLIQIFDKQFWCENRYIIKKL